MTNVTGVVRDVVDAWMDTADPRAKVLPLMSSPYPLLCIEITFLSFVCLGPKIMQHRKPFQLKQILLFYNPAMCLFNFLLVFFLLVKVFTREKISWTCMDVDRSPTQDAMEMVYIGWLSFISKVIEMSDTVFFILRKKYSQLSFLHIFHHSTVAILLWLCANWLPGGQVWLAVLINSALHVIMYGYYTLAAIGPHMQKYLWWKRYLTSLQMAQFIIVIIHCFINEMTECSFPKIYNKLMMPYYLLQFAMFLNFYTKTYNKTKKTE